MTDAGPSTVTEAFYGLNYAVQVAGDGPIKIGFTRTAASTRMASLQQASPYELLLVAQWPATELHEKRIHSVLSPYRLRREWYHPVAPVKDRILKEVEESRDRESERLAFLRSWTGGALDIVQYAFSSRFKGDAALFALIDQAYLQSPLPSSSPAETIPAGTGQPVADLPAGHLSEDPCLSAQLAMGIAA